MNDYKWKTGSCINIDANVAGKVCEELSNDGKLTPQQLVDVSRPEDAPLHSAFEWDDSIAAENYRNIQGGKIIRSLEVVIKGSEGPTRAFVNITIKEEQGNYKDIETVLTCKDYAEQLLDDARRDMNNFINKYKCLAKLASVIEIMQLTLDTEVAA